MQASAGEIENSVVSPGLSPGQPETSNFEDGDHRWLEPLVHHHQGVNCEDAGLVLGDKGFLDRP